MSSTATHIRSTGRWYRLEDARPANDRAHLHPAAEPPPSTTGWRADLGAPMQQPPGSKPVASGIAVDRPLRQQTATRAWQSDRVRRGRRRGGRSVGREALAPTSVIARSIDRRIPRSIAESGSSPDTSEVAIVALRGTQGRGIRRVRQQLLGLLPLDRPRAEFGKSAYRNTKGRRVSGLRIGYVAPATPPRPSSETSSPIYDTTVPNCVRLPRLLQHPIDDGD